MNSFVANFEKVGNMTMDYIKSKMFVDEDFEQQAAKNSQFEFDPTNSAQKSAVQGHKAVTAGKSPNVQRRIFEPCPCKNCVSGRTEHRDNVKIHNCPVPNCEKYYRSPREVKSHILVHRGIRPFACNHPGCGKKFTKPEFLSRHSLSHTGIRNHECQFCKKKFIRKYHLIRHIGTHQFSVEPSILRGNGGAKYDGSDDVVTLQKKNDGTWDVFF